MFLFYVLSFFKIGDTIQGGTLFKGGIIQGNTVHRILIELKLETFLLIFIVQYASKMSIVLP